MISSVVDGVIPVALLIAFGFALGKRGVFGPDATAAFAKLVISIALPVDLFLAAIATPRSQLTNARYIGAIAITFVGLYAITFAVGRRLLRNRTRDSAVEALFAALPRLRQGGVSDDFGDHGPEHHRLSGDSGAHLKRSWQGEKRRSSPSW
jgi:predicted permease